MEARAGIEPAHRAFAELGLTTWLPRLNLRANDTYESLKHYCLSFSIPYFYTFGMKDENAEKGWERTNVTNLLRNGQSGTYYARVKVNGKQKWKSLKTTLFSVAKLRLADFEAHVRAMGATEIAEDATTAGAETNMARFIAVCRQRTENDSSLAPATKGRRETAMKAILKTWPDLPNRDARRVTATDCQQWAVRALREGTGFVAPKAKTVRKGMSPGALNKCIEVLTAVFEIARQQGIVYENPAKTVSKVPVRAKRLELPTNFQFHELVQAIAGAGSRASQDCADMVRFLAYSGTRLAEATSLQWASVEFIKKQIIIAGTKTSSSYRTIPIIPPLAELLDEIRSRRGVEPADATVLAIRECKGALRTACSLLKIKKLVHHDLRHFFATRCIESGVDIPTVSRWLGHSDGGALAMKTYGHLRQEHSTAQAAKVIF